MRLKDVGYLYGGLTGKSGDDFHEEDPDKVKPFIPFTNVFKNFKVDVSDVRYVAMEAGEVQNRVRQGDVLFLMSSEDYDGIGKPAVISDEVPELYLNSFCRGLRITKRNICPEFVNYYLNAHHCREKIRLEGRGFTRVNIKLDRIAGQELNLPPVVDQQRIVENLDSRCEAIDRTVALLERKRTAYGKLKRALINETVTRGLDKNAKLVDSGVDWIGMVPEGWRRVEFKTLVDLRNGADYKHIETEDGIPVVGSGGVFAYCSRKMYEGEVVFLGRKGTIDRPLHFNGAFWAVDTMFYAIPRRYRYRQVNDTGNVGRARISVAPQFSRYVNPSRGGDVVGRYVYYLATAFPFQKIATATALPSTTQTDLNSLVVCVPDAAVQRRIADYLDRKCAAIDAAVENVTRQIELYRKLKRSLIDEVMTGRRKVA